jgi:hypothetical protein
MIVRIVKMTFQPGKSAAFMNNFEKHKERIRNFNGCEKLLLLQDVNESDVYFTYSWWQSESHLNAYRESELFKGVWKFTKTLFSARAQAWSTIEKAAL